MSFRDCLTTAVVRGLLEQGKADDALKLFDDMVEELRAQGIADDAARVKAAQNATEQVKYQLARQKKLLVLGNSARHRVSAAMRDWRSPEGKESYADGLLSMVERDEYGTANTYVGRKGVVQGLAHARMVSVLEAFGPKKAGLQRPKAGLRSMVREVFGEKTGDEAAAEMATAWKETAEFLRQRANQAGADIAKRDDWNFPNTHDWGRVAKAGKQQWVDFIVKNDLAAWNRMYNEATGRTLENLDIEEKIQVLGKMYDTIKTDGYVKLEGKGAGRGSMLANRLGQERFLQFKDADSWLKYQDEFGVGTPFDAMINHIDSMSHDIAMLEIFGPNPELMRRWAKEQARARAGQLDAARTGPAKESSVVEVDKKLRKFDEIWGMVTNQNALLKGDWMGFTLAGTRNMLTATHLGSASLAAIPGDFLAVKMVKKMNKMEGSRFIKEYLGFMIKDPLLNESSRRQLAMRLGLIAEAATNIAYGQQRLLGQITGPQFTQRINDIFMRLSLMTPHTQAARWAFGMEFLGALADNAGKGFDELPFKGVMQRYGITADEWEAIRKTPLYEERGATFLRPDDVLSNNTLQPVKARALSDKLMEMVHGEMRVAVQEPTLRARAFLVGDSKPGTLGGELVRSAAMFKNFPVSILFLHWRRAMLHGTTRGRAGYLAAFGLGLTMVGALSTQMRQVTQGKDPINMNPATPEGRAFWGNASLAGGGLGIWGDFLFRDVNRFGGGPMETAAGPVVGFVSDTVKLSTGNVVELAQGKDTNFAPEMLSYIRRYMPGQSLWYTRLVLQREVFDQIQREIDPKAYSKWQRQKTEIKNNYGQDFWWKPGQAAPSRAPDFGAVAQ